MNSICTTVTRRPARPGDDSLLRELFAESRPDLAALPPDLRAVLIDMQFRAQRSQYATSYPDARYEILVADGSAVGQLILVDDEHAVRVVDVGVLPAHRGQGVASTVLREIVADAQRLGRPVRLSVWSGNTEARRLYGRLGFVRTDQSHPSTIGYVEMRTI